MAIETSLSQLELFALKYEHTYKELKERKRKREEIKRKADLSKKEYHQLSLNLSLIDDEISCLEEDRKYLYRLLSKTRLEKEGKEIWEGRPKCSYWWRRYLKPKSYYQIPEEGDKGIITDIMLYFRWLGDWTLKTWWGRVPSRTLWEFSLEVVKLWGNNKRSSKLFLMVLSTIAELFREFSDFGIWKGVKNELPRWVKYPKLSLKLLLFLLRKFKEKLEKSIKENFLKGGGNGILEKIKIGFILDFPSPSCNKKARAAPGSPISRLRR